MEIRQIEYVVAVVEQGTFTAAARACFVAQPSLSQAVRALEQELGVELFHRTGRGAVPTAAGEAFAARGRVALRALDGVRHVGVETAEMTLGRLDLVALPTLFDVASDMIGALRRQHPGVTVRLAHPESNDDLLDRIAEGRSELGLAELPARRAGLVTKAIGSQELVAVGAAALLPANDDPIDAAALAQLPLILAPPGTSIRRSVEAACARAGAVPTVVVQTEQREAIGPLAAAGAGVAVLPRRAADQLATERGVQVRALRPALVRRIGLVWRRAPLSPAAQAFSATVR